LPTDRDDEFARIAVELGLLTQEQADTLLADLSAAESLGSGDSLAEIALKRGLLYPADCKALHEKVEHALRERVELGGFQLLEKIGRGGMGAVYRARQLSMDRVVAVKILSRRLSKDRDYVERFIREARAAAKLDHPNIVQGIDVGESSGYYYFAMEFVNGETVAEKIKRAGPLPEKEVLTIGAQVARALEHAHSRAGVIHRDVKPQNILIDPNGVAKLADLGLAREAAKDETSVTHPGIALGTPDYIAPEQIRGAADLDGRCDIYSLGATLFHMLTGRPPYTGETPNVIMAKHLTEPAPDPAAHGVRVAPATAAVVRKAMRKDKAARYATAGAMAEAIGAALRALEEPAVAPAGRAGHRARRRQRSLNRTLPVILLIGGIIVVLLLALFLAAHATSRDDDRSESPGERPPELVLPEPSADEPGPVEHDGRVPGKDAYEYARKVVEAHEDEPWKTIRELHDMIDLCKGTEYEPKVRALLDAALREVDRVAAPELARLEKKAAELCRRNRFGKAADVFRAFPDHLMVGEWPRKVGLARNAVQDRADEAFRALAQHAESAAATGDLDKAMDTLRPATRWGVPEVEQAARKRIQAWTAKQTERERAKQGERMRTLIRHRAHIIEALRERRYADARTRAATAAEEPPLRKHAAEFKHFVEDISRLQSLWQTAEARLRAMRPGDDIRLKSILRKFVKYEDGVVHAEVSGLVETLPLRSMSHVDLFHSNGLLADRFEAAAPRLADLFARGLFYTFDRDRDLDQARRDVEAAAKGGLADEARRGRFYLGLVARLNTERAALAALEAARTAAGAGQWKTVQEQLRTLAKHRETQTWKKSRAEVDELRRRALGRGKDFRPGLIGIYFSGTDFNRFRATRVDKRLELSGGDMAKAARQERVFSVRWEGCVKITEPGRYRFGLVADDGFRFWFDGKKALDRWSISPRNEATTRPIQLEPGLYPIKIEYFQAGGGAHVRFRWTRGRRRETVPPDALVHPAYRAEELGVQ
jgi:serine/threonine-protein kinase